MTACCPAGIYQQMRLSRDAHFSLGTPAEKEKLHVIQELAGGKLHFIILIVAAVPPHQECTFECYLL